MFVVAHGRHAVHDAVHDAVRPAGRVRPYGRSTPATTSIHSSSCRIILHDAFDCSGKEEIECEDVIRPPNSDLRLCRSRQNLPRLTQLQPGYCALGGHIAGSYGRGYDRIAAVAEPRRRRVRRAACRCTYRAPVGVASIFVLSRGHQSVELRIATSITGVEHGYYGQRRHRLRLGSRPGWPRADEPVCEANG